MLSKQVALPPSFDSFFSFPMRKTGYSGTAVYTRKSLAVPLKAEEGISGVLRPRPPLNEDERISKYESYPVQDDEEQEFDLKDLDSEGRAVVVDFGLFVLINVYCPNDGTGSEERETFKMGFHKLLEMRIRSLIREGREVMLVGDLNACAAVEDHCEGRIMVEQGLAAGLQGEEGFWGKDSRRWLRDLIIQGDGTGIMVDIVRKYWPDRQGMYTCTRFVSYSIVPLLLRQIGWNTKISARATNYGTRIDFILITPGLVPWVKAADIQPSVKGSDHCPVYVDLHDEIINADGSNIKLGDVLGSGLTEPPRLAAKYWDEHKQKLLSTFFGKKSGGNQPEKSKSLSPTQNPAIDDDNRSLTTPTMLNSASQSAVLNSSNSPHSATPALSDIIPPVSQLVVAMKRRLVPEDNPSVKKPKIVESSNASSGKTKQSGQGTLTSFFGPPKASSSKDAVSKSKAKTELSPIRHREHEHLNSNEVVDEDADYRFALQLSQSEENIGPLPNSQGSSNGASKDKWTSLLAPTKPPNCSAHNEPSKEFTVNKPGPNKGKRFFVCARCVFVALFYYDQNLVLRVFQLVLLGLLGRGTIKDALNDFDSMSIRSINVISLCGRIMPARRWSRKVYETISRSYKRSRNASRRWICLKSAVYLSSIFQTVAAFFA